MSMKVVTKLDLGHDFDSNIKIKIGNAIETAIELTTCKHAKSTKGYSNHVVNAEKFNQELVTEIRRLVHASYSMGVTQGIAKQKAFIDSLPKNEKQFDANL